ncbi:hypothetical protein GCM10009602_19110 [Nocardiopsis tropica]
MELLQACDGVVEGGVGRQVEDHRADLGAQEVVGAGGAEGGQARVLRSGEEVQDHVGVGEAPDLGVVGGGQAAQDGGQGGGPLAALGGGQRAVAGQGRPEGLGAPAFGEERLGGADDLQGVGLALLAGVRPGGDAVAAQDRADGSGVLLGDPGDVQAQLEAGPPPGHPDDAVAEALPGEPLAVLGGGQGDAGVGVQVVDVGGADEAVHGGVDGGGRASPSEQAVVEGGDHLVLALLARVDVDEGAQTVQAQDGEAVLGEGAEVAPGALDPQEFDGPSGDGVGPGAGGGGVAPGEVGVARVGAQGVAAGDELVDDGVGHGAVSLRGAVVGGCVRLAHAPHPAWVPPLRSSVTRSM